MITYRLGDYSDRRMAMIKRDSVGGEWGEPEVITDFRCGLPEFAPSGDAIACFDGTRQMVLDLTGEILWEWLPEPGETIGWGTYRPDGSLVVRKNLIGEMVVETWLVRPIRGAEPTLLFRERDYGQQHVSRATDDRIFMNRKELEGDLIVLDLQWE
jgi:hypothetical protein